MLCKLFPLFVWAALGTFSRLAFAGGCPLTEVPQYAFDCGILVDLREPVIIEVYNKTATEIDCAQHCLDHKKCRSLRWDEKKSKCYLFAKHINQMYPEYENYQDGKVWERNCFTTNCGIIDSCAAAESCRVAGFEYDPGSYYSTSYYQYACSYGKTAMSSTPKGRKYGVFREFLLNGSLSACDAVGQCAMNFDSGSLDTHYDLTSNQWVCILYGDYKTGAPLNTPGSEHVSRTRYSAKNSTVGAGYGYIPETTFYYYAPGF